MPQQSENSKPYFLDLDSALEDIAKDGSPYLHGLTFDVNANPGTAIGTNNQSGEGQNLMVLTPVRSNVAISAILPTGYNRCIGEFECLATQEVYHFNFNSSGRHGIYVLSGNTGVWQQVVMDAELGFVENSEAEIAWHRVILRAVYDDNKNITEKHLAWTDGNKWQGWVNVIAAISTNFDAINFPYWRLRQPHLDKRELLEWPTRPPMIKPVVRTLPNTAADSGKINRLADKCFQFTYYYVNTDGRVTHSAPYSLPLIVASTDYLQNPQNLPKSAELKLYAGSALTEKIGILVREGQLLTGAGSTVGPQWGDWYLVETIDRFKEKPTGAYWLRNNEWADYSFDPAFNTVLYTFDNTRSGQIVDQQWANQIFTEMPLRSVALSNVDDAALLANNEYNYDNFSRTLMDKFDVIVKEKPDVSCPVKLRKLTLYAYIGRCGQDFTYTSQVGFYLGEDKQIKFGGMTVGTGDRVDVNKDEVGNFELNFADRSAFRCYLKGTPYYADGTWYHVNQDDTMVKIDAPYDLGNSDTQKTVQEIFFSQGYFICRFDFLVPEGRYIAALGRHNTPSSGDYRGTSTWVYGIANSRKKKQNTGFIGIPFISIHPADALVSSSKEIEVDVTAADLDVWGNGRDLFYVYCPYIPTEGNKRYRFIEGYFHESRSNAIPVEHYPFHMTRGATDDFGVYTDKNGFYWSYTKVANSNVVDIEFKGRMNCDYPESFTVVTAQPEFGYRKNPLAYFADHNNGVVGDCNRVLVRGKVSSIDGTIPYSNVALSMVDGPTTYTGQDGTFEMVVHNGFSDPRAANIAINAGGNFQVTIANCGQLPLLHYSESVVPCTDCNIRIYPIQYDLRVQIYGLSETSLKQGGKYNVGVYAADLAGRLTFVQNIKTVTVPSFQERNNNAATYLQAQMLIPLQFTQEHPDLKWLTFCVSPDRSQKGYVQWVGDKISYIDAAGNITNQPSQAEFCAITIQSLYDYNVSNNFSVLARYQFQKGDRLKVLDDGAGTLFDVATYGNSIDIQVLGTNYNQAAIEAGLLPPTVNTVQSADQTSLNTSVTIIVRYDSRLNAILDKKGFWIELYTPTQLQDVFPYSECAGFHPIVNGEVAEFIGMSPFGLPTFNNISTVDLEFWDTYLIRRTISVPDQGSLFLGHPFESPHVNDTFGGNMQSGGRQWIKNDVAKKRWYSDNTIKSYDFVREGMTNGLAGFGPNNKKDFRGFGWGGIVAVIEQRSTLLFICENDWFMTNYNLHYSYANEQGIMVTNLNNGLSEPMPKIGSVYGLSYKHTRTVVSNDGNVYWLDGKNTAFIKCNYRSASDISQRIGQQERGGIQSYLNAKMVFMNQWNDSHDVSEQWDAVSGIDEEGGKVYLTFRPRRRNANDAPSYGCLRRTVDVRHQETFVYSTQYSGWIGKMPFAPEGYARLRGAWANVEMITFAAGLPYRHNNGTSTSFLNFYGVQYEPVFVKVFNENKEQVKVAQAIAHNSNDTDWFCDLIYTPFPNSFSFLTVNQFKKKLGISHAAVLRNANSYPDPNDSPNRVMLFDGYKMSGRYIVVRFVGSYDSRAEYKQLSSVHLLTSNDGSNKK